MPLYLNFEDPKIKIFRDFRIFVLSQKRKLGNHGKNEIPKNENSEVTEIRQKRHNTEI